MVEQVDEVYFSALADEDKLFPISDEKYADELQLQEVLLVSFYIAALERYGLPTTNIKRAEGQASPIETKKVKIEQGETSNATIKTERVVGEASPIETKKVEIEQGETSNATIKTETFCKICMEAYPSSHIFFSTSCSHTFCRDCLSKHVSTIIEQNISAVECPEVECKAMLEPGDFQGIIPKQVFDRWGSALCESMVLGAEKHAYCPFKDCSALLLGDEGDNVVQSECPHCWRLFCASCGVAWHSGLSCEEFKKLGEDERGGEDLKLAEIAKSNKWKRCPECRFYVEKTTGCLHVTCRCKYEFCYGCGQKWSLTHGGCGGA